MTRKEPCCHYCGERVAWEASYHTLCRETDEQFNTIIEFELLREKIAKTVDSGGRDS